MRKSDDPMYCIHEFGIDTDNLELYLVGESLYNVGCGGDEGDQSEPGVEYNMSSRFIKNLRILSILGTSSSANKKKGEHKYKTITIHCKTCGGDWSEGMAIYDAIKLCPNPTVILNYTHARSMSSIIFQAATKRVMMPHSYFMLHQGDATVSGTVKQVESIVEFSKKDNEIMVDIYAERMKKTGKIWRGSSLSSIKAWLNRQMDSKEDVYLTAKEAVDHGLADEIFNGNWAKLKEI